MNFLDRVYTQTSTGSSGISTLLALFDRLARDLQNGARAQRAQDIERRCKELNHALAVVGFLENWLDETSGPLAQELAAFYCRLRHRILAAQAKQSAAMLEEEVAATLTMREIWQQVAVGETQPAAEVLPPERGSAYPGMAEGEQPYAPLSWSA